MSWKQLITRRAEISCHFQYQGNRTILTAGEFRDLKVPINYKYSSQMHRLAGIIIPMYEEDMSYFEKVSEEHGSFIDRIKRNIRQLQTLR